MGKALAFPLPAEIIFPLPLQACDERRARPSSLSGHRSHNRLDSLVVSATLPFISKQDTQVGRACVTVFSDNEELNGCVHRP